MVRGCRDDKDNGDQGISENQDTMPQECEIPGYIV